MTPERQQAIWAIVLEHYRAAQVMDQYGWYNVSVACSYYAIYNAMWTAVGDPPKKRWEHEALIMKFAQGSWGMTGERIGRKARKDIVQSFYDRIGAQYHGKKFTWLDSVEGLMRARYILSLIADTFGFSLGDVV